jgi:hypothetical protein
MKEMIPKLAEEEEEIRCPEGQVVKWVCEPPPCQWFCK